MGVFSRKKNKSSDSLSSGGSSSTSSTSSSLERKQPAHLQPLKSSLHSSERSSTYDSSRSGSCRSGSCRSYGSQHSSQKSVRFSQVHVREYERSLGDNPSCSSGAPIGIGWAFQNSLALEIEEYERHYKRGRPQNEIVLSRQEREQLLREWCTTEKDIVQSTRDNLKVKFQRRRSVRNARKMDLFQNTIGKGLKKVLGIRGHKSDEFLLQAVPEMGLVTQSPDLVDSHEQYPEVSEPEEEEEVDESGEGRPSARASILTSARLLRKQSESFEDMVDDTRSAVSGLTFGDSTTTSAYEMEMFHRELELELFGVEPDEPLPPRSMLGEALAVPDVSSESNSMSIVSGSNEEEISSSSSTMYDSFQSPSYSYYGSPQMSISPVPQMSISPVPSRDYSVFQNHQFPQQHYHQTYHAQYNQYARASAYRGYSIRDAYRNNNKSSAFDRANQQLQAPPLTPSDPFHVVEVTEPDDVDDTMMTMMPPYPLAGPSSHNIAPPMYPPMMDHIRNNNNYADVLQPLRYSSDDSRNAFSDVRSWEEFYCDMPEQDSGRRGRSRASSFDSSYNHDSSSMKLSSNISYKSSAELSVDFSHATNLTERTQHC